MRSEIRFLPTIDDHVAGQRLWLQSYWRRPWFKLLLGMIAVLELVTIAISIHDWINGHSLWAILNDKAVPLFCPLIFPAIIVLNWARMPANIRKMAAQQPSLFTETVWRWDDAGLIAEAAAGTSRIAWPELYRWLANDQTIVLSPQERIVLILPRRFLSEEQAVGLIATMERFAVKARRT